MLLTLTLEQQELIDNRSDFIHALAGKIWDSVNEIDYDPMHPRWESFDDPIKDKYIEAATYILVSNECDSFVNKD